VDVHVWWLRRKLEQPGQPSHFLTVRGIGYRFVDPDR
jgi:DNA-binding response OmpR family regulator